MIYLELFWAFFKIGLFTIGGGHAMIPLIMRNIVANGWLSKSVLLDFIAISESTPGPFAVNIATYTGVEVAGVFGGICATVGVVLPSFIIILFVAKFFTKQMQKPFVQDVFSGLRAGVVGLLASVFLMLILQVVFSIGSVWEIKKLTTDWIALGLFVFLFAISSVKIKGRKMHPIILILLSAGCGMLFYSF